MRPGEDIGLKAVRQKFQYGDSSAPRLAHSPATRLLISFLLCLLTLSCMGPLSAEEKYPEYEVKATLLVKLVQFATWPESALPAEGDPFRIGILGSDPFEKAIDEASRLKDFDGREIRIQRSRNIDDLLGCQLVFIAASEADRMEKSLDMLAGKPVLTIGDHAGFAQRGLMINLLLQERKVTFEINYGAVKKAGLDLDAQLLKLATIVETETPKEPDER